MVSLNTFLRLSRFSFSPLHHSAVCTAISPTPVQWLHAVASLGHSNVRGRLTTIDKALLCLVDGKLCSPDPDLQWSWRVVLEM